MPKIGPKEQQQRALRERNLPPYARAMIEDGLPEKLVRLPGEKKAANVVTPPSTTPDDKPRAPAEPVAATQESAMKKAKTSKKTSSKKVAKAKAPKRAKASAAHPAEKKTATDGVREGSKLETIVKMLQRPTGCTSKEVLEATKWPSVSMPQQAKAAGIELATEKTGRTTRYWDKGTKPKAEKEPATA